MGILHATQIQTHCSIPSLKRQCQGLYGSFSTRYMGNSRLTGRVCSNAPIKIQWGKHRKTDGCRKRFDLCWVYSTGYILEHFRNPFPRLKLLVTFLSPSLEFLVNFYIIYELFCFIILPLFYNLILLSNLAMWYESLQHRGGRSGWGSCLAVPAKVQYMPVCFVKELSV